MACSTALAIWSGLGGGDASGESRAPWKRCGVAKSTVEPNGRLPVRLSEKAGAVLAAKVTARMATSTANI